MRGRTFGRQTSPQHETPSKPRVFPTSSPTKWQLREQSNHMGENFILRGRTSTTDETIQWRELNELLHY